MTDMKRRLLIIVVCLLLGAVIVVLVGCGNPKAEDRQLPEAAAAPLAATDPGISLREEHLSGFNVDCWQITNTRDEPLTIHRVLFNAEWEPPVLDATTWDRISPPYPQTLTVGGTRLLPWKGNATSGKEVIYIDLYTDRGNFRYRPSEGFKALAD